MTTRRIFASMLASGLAGFSGLALATDVFRLEGYGAISRGMGGTAVAHDVGPAGMMTNPATLSLMQEDDQIMVGLDLVTTDIEVKNKNTGERVSSSDHGSNRGPYAAPELAYTKRFGDWALGIGAFAQGGLGTEYGTGSFLSRATGGLNTGLDNSSRLLVLNIPIAASFKVSEKLAIGGSLDAMWQGLNLNLLLGADQVGSLITSGRANGTLVPVLGGLPDMRGAHFSLTKNQPLGSGVEAWGYSGKLGMIYKATQETTLGASYTFKSQMDDMDGGATLTAVDGIAGQIPLKGKIKIQDFQMPAHLDLGLSQRLSSQWAVAVDVSQVFWKDVMKDIKVAFVADPSAAVPTGGTLNILLPQDYKDQTILSLGTSYALNDQLTLRGGMRFATQALRSSTLFAVIPATPSKHLSLGFSYKFSPTSCIDFAFSHALQEKMSNSKLPNTSEPIEVKHSQNNATLNYSLSF